MSDIPTIMTIDASNIDPDYFEGVEGYQHPEFCSHDHKTKDPGGPITCVDCGQTFEAWDESSWSSMLDGTLGL